MENPTLISDNISNIYVVIIFKESFFLYLLHIPIFSFFHAFLGLNPDSNFLKIHVMTCPAVVPSASKKKQTGAAAAICVSSKTTDPMDVLPRKTAQKVSNVRRGGSGNWR